MISLIFKHRWFITHAPIYTRARPSARTRTTHAHTRTESSRNALSVRKDAIRGAKTVAGHFIRPGVLRGALACRLA